MKLDEKNVKEKRANVWSAMAAAMELAATENRGLTVDEAAEYDRREDELKSLERELARIKTYNERSEAEQELAETRGQSVDEAATKRDLENRAFIQFLRRGVNGIEPKLKPYFATRTQYDAGMNEAGFQSTGTAGGFTVPQGFWQNLQIALKAYGGIMSLARTVNTSAGNPMDWPTVDPTSVVGHIVGEGVQDSYTDFTFGKGVLQAWTYTSGVILVSIELANDSAFSVDEFVRDRIGEAIGRAVAAHLQTGTGTGQPLGIQTALAAATTSGSGGLYQSTAGSGATVATLAGTSTTKLSNGLISFSDILGMVHNIDPAYRASGRCTWVMNDTTLQMLRSITDQYGRPLWQPDVSGSAPDTIYRYPYVVDNTMGNVSTTQATAGGLLFGDFQSAMVVRVVDQADVMRLTERYADARQVGYFGFCRLDARGNDMRAATLYKTQAAA